MRVPKRFMAALAALFFLLGWISALADGVELRGYTKKEKYQYITFGSYPTQEDGTEGPVLWRVLGVEDGVACLMTQYVIDFIPFNDRKDKKAEGPLEYRDALICKTLNEETVKVLFDETDQTALRAMEDGRGVLSVPSKEELHRVEYGFKNGDFTVDNNRFAQGTPYAYGKGLVKFLETGGSWYWTTVWRRPGFRWIVGDNGHISVTGIARPGGLRPICYVKESMLVFRAGTGTKEDPYQARVK